MTSVITSRPWLRRALWKGWYDFLAGGYRQPEWTFMNYGFAEPQGLDASADVELALESADEPDRYSIQLYHRTTGEVDLRDLDVLEVGSGRGGGSAYLARYLEPASMLGVDYSAKAVALSRERHAAVPRLDFRQGDAESLPSGDAAFDVVINVESSHCYGSMERFLREVFRVLRPGGYFLWADMRPRGQWSLACGQFVDAGFDVRQEENITPGVLRALDCVNDRKREMIRRHVPRYLAGYFEGFAGVRGTRVYESLRTGAVEYRRCTLQKPAPRAPS